MLALRVSDALQATTTHKEAGGRVALVPPAARALAPGPEEVPRATCSTLAVLARIWTREIEL